MSPSYDVHTGMFKVERHGSLQITLNVYKKYDELIEEWICDKANKSIKMLITECMWWWDNYSIIINIFITTFNN